MKYFIVTIAVLTLLFGCSTNQNHIVGKWKMHQIIQDGKDVTKEHNPENDRYFIMNEDGSFQSGGQPYGKNAGKYTYDKEAKTLFIDSDEGPEDDSNWRIKIQNDMMSWQGVGTAWAERFRVIHVRE